MTQRKPLIIVGAIVVAFALVIALYLFQPWALFTNKQVNEALPSASPSTSSGSGAATAPAAPTEVSSGSFVSFEHETTGTGAIYKSADGTQILRLTDFETSNGPDVKVWLSVNLASAAEDARSAKYVDLGELKGNIGNQNYALPATADGTTWKSVVIWCDRFSAAFGAADLK